MDFLLRKKNIKSTPVDYKQYKPEHKTSSSHQKLHQHLPKHSESRQIQQSLTLKSSSEDIIQQSKLIIKDVADMEKKEIEEKKINPYNFNNRFIKKNEIENILRRYGIFQTVNDLALYQRAFTHDSYSWNHTKEIMERDDVKIVDKPEGALEIQEMSYQRLEFLGDRVVNLIIAFYLFERYPQQNEGFMTKIYSKIVDSKGLAKLARKVNFGQYILFSRHLDEKNNARNKDKYLEDCFEAFIGALFYDFASKLNSTGYVTVADFIIGPGFQICQKFIVNLIEDEETGIDFAELIGKDRNYKQKMNTYFQNYGLKGKYIIDKNENIYVLDEGEISFGSDADEAPNNYSYQDRIWWVTLKDNNDKVYASSYAREKQQAEQKAAYLALVKLGREKNQQDPDFEDSELDEWISVYNLKQKNN
jgi:dsRNA-specific ribonuclease